ncbi:MAG: hypothetical protein K9N09_03065 [Candidatus Cloacimonetes bacterium]|nr:hypothetical protein [Candidatus Cloacimonadota bacterium]MCF7814814.1 hypothetical protein [Candidatus Cloacimonadota bacterium]MCF7867656.1 hypothetical protein [Candidatus Cloacimonadota bacterium]MCF7883546.1 hypothetical protein [Candidatus Cloacimonadota bacterium]
MDFKNISKIIFEFDTEDEPKLNNNGEFTIKLPIVADLLKISEIYPDIQIILISKRTSKIFELEHSTQGFRIHPKLFDSSYFK